jgi:hypothetical protein
MSDKDIYDQIEAYLNGELSEADNLLFEKEISNNKQLSEQLKLHQTANEAILQQRLLSIKNMLIEEHSKADQDNNNLFRNGIAGIIGVVLIASLTYWGVRNDTNEPVQPSTSTFSQKPNQSSKQVVTDSKKKTYSQPDQTIPSHVPGESTVNPHNDIDAVASNSNDKSISTVLPVKDSVHHHRDMPQQNIKPTPVSLNVCDGVIIDADIKTAASCEDETNGSILVYGIQGGTKPYDWNILNDHMQTMQEGRLDKGTYKVVITDANNCKRTYTNLLITEKPCDKDYSFNPFRGEVWQIPSYSLNGELSIYEKSGNLYHQQTIPASSGESWNGLGKNNELETGYFIFIIHYTDGSSRRGSVTIVR